MHLARPLLTDQHQRVGLISHLLDAVAMHGFALVVPLLHHHTGAVGVPLLAGLAVEPDRGEDVQGDIWPVQLASISQGTANVAGKLGLVTRPRNLRDHLLALLQARHVVVGQRGKAWGLVRLADHRCLDFGGIVEAILRGPGLFDDREGIAHPVSALTVE